MVFTFLHTYEVCSIAIPVGEGLDNFRVEFPNCTQSSKSDCFGLGRFPAGRGASGSAFARSGEPDCFAPCASLTRAVI